MRRSAAPATAAPVRSRGSGIAPHILDLQSVVGNTAVSGMLRTFAGLPIARTVDTEAPGAVPAALDDPSFNADSITHDLLRAIDKKRHTFVMERNVEVPSKERRNIEFAKVVEVLENRTASQIAEIKKRYRAFEGRELTFDLFEGGESNRQSSLTDDQRTRLQILLRGTRAEPISNQLEAELKHFPPEIAAQLGASIAAKGNAAAAVQQLEADSIEVRELLVGELDEPHIEHLMAMYRRPTKDITAMEALYAHRFGPGMLEFSLTWRLGGLQRSRIEALRRGDLAQADAFAIEAKRRKIAELGKQEQEAAGAYGDSSIGDAIRQTFEKKKAALSSDVEAILNANRRDALADPANAGKSSGKAVAERLDKILSQHVGDSGNTLAADLTQTVPSAHANIIAAAANNTGDSASLIGSAAAELVAMEKDHTTKAVRIIETLKSFRHLAEHDLRAHVLDPKVKLEEKEAIAADIENALTSLAQKYIQEYRAAYNRQKPGDGRTYDAIIASASKANETYIGDLTAGGGRTSTLGELQHAMDDKDIDKVKQILRNQSGQEAVQELIAAYNRLGGGRDLRKDLFGALPDGGTVSAEDAETKYLPSPMRGLVQGRDAAQIEEQLGKPAAAALAGKSGTAGEAEVKWLAKGGAQEFEATMSNRGATGHIREWGGDPETEHLLKASNEQLATLRAQWEAAKTPAERQHLILEIRKTRAALTGDADAYEKDNERVLGEIRGVLSLAVSIALAVAIPGAGAGLAAFIETTAINIAANVAANMVIKGGEYGWDDLRGDVLGGVLGAAGGKFGEELLGRVAAKVTAPAAKAAAGAGEKVGIQTALAKELSSVAGSGERVVIGAEEFGAKEAGHEAATVVGGEGGASAGGAGAKQVTQATERGLLESGARDLGGLFGGIYGGKIATGEFGLSVDEVLQALAGMMAGKLAHGHKAQEAGSKEDAPPPKHGAAEEPTRAPEEEPERRKPDEPEHEPEPSGGGGGGPAGPESKPPPGDVFGPTSPAEMLAANGIPAENGQAFQAFADHLDAVVWLRPTNTASLKVMYTPEGGRAGLPKPEMIKAKTINRVDMLIGGPQGQEGKVGFFEPTMPSAEILNALNPAAREAVVDRYNTRLKDFNDPHYKELMEHGLVQAKDGVLQVADPRQGASGEPTFKDVGGDADVYDIRHADGSELNSTEREQAIKMLRSMGINVEHGFHTAWEQDSPGTYSKEGDDKIRSQHRDKEPLVVFVPKSQVRLEFADTEVRGPVRKPGPADPHQPLKSAEIVTNADQQPLTMDQGPQRPEEVPGMGGPGKVHTPGETDFSSLNDPSHKPETPLRGPAKRHAIEKVDQKTLAKEKNTVILASVDVPADVAAINAGQGTRLGPTTYMVNGRMYGSHDGTLYPISGPGFIQLGRGAFKALGVYNRFGETPRAQEILDRMGMSESDRAAALNAHRAAQGG